MIRLVLSEANPQVREGLSVVLAGDPEILVEAAVGHNTELAEAVGSIRPTVVVLAGDAQSVDAAEACATLSRTHPRVRALVAISAAREAAMMDALAAGARGVVIKDAAPAVLRRAVRTVAAGWSFVDPRLMSKLVQAALRGHEKSGVGGLSSEELRVVQRMLLGLDDAEIAHSMGLAEDDVRTYVHNVRVKLGARDRAETGAIARREGLV